MPVTKPGLESCLAEDKLIKVPVSCTAESVVLVGKQEPAAPSLGRSCRDSPPELLANKETRLCCPLEPPERLEVEDWERTSGSGDVTGGVATTFSSFCARRFSKNFMTAAEMYDESENHRLAERRLYENEGEPKKELEFYKKEEMPRFIRYAAR